MLHQWYLLCMYVCIYAVFVWFCGDYAVFLGIMTAARTSDGKTSIIKQLDSVHLGRWVPDNSCTSSEKRSIFPILSLTHTSIHPPPSERITKAFLSTGRPFSLSSSLPHPLHQVSSFSCSPCWFATQSDMKLTIKIHSQHNCGVAALGTRSENKLKCMLPPIIGTRKFLNTDE